MDQVIVSVIIPVYNTEKYVEEAIRSILDQTLKDIEVIIVNDGSTDNSLTILQHIAATDHRVSVFSQANQGQATARNLGLSKAKGKYVYFMDSDDLLESQCLQLCVEKCDTDHLDFVFFDAESFSLDQNLKIGYTYRRCNQLEDRVYSGLEITNILLDLDGFRVAPWLQLISREYLTEIQLKYQVTTHEDELFTDLLFVRAKRVGCINQVFFHRRLRSASVVTTPFSAKNLNAYIFIIDQLIAFDLQFPDGKFHKTIERMVVHILNGTMYKTRELGKKDRMKLLKRMTPGYVFKVKPSFLFMLIYGHQ